MCTESFPQEWVVSVRIICTENVLQEWAVSVRIMSTDSFQQFWDVSARIMLTENFLQEWIVSVRKMFKETFLQECFVSVRIMCTVHTHNLCSWQLQNMFWCTCDLHGCPWPTCAGDKLVHSLCDHRHCFLRDKWLEFLPVHGETDDYTGKVLWLLS